jgi:hypothetical protein
MGTIRITESLKWQALEARYYIGNVVVDGKSRFVNALKDAIDDGSFEKLVQECADELHEGNLYEAYTYVAKNLSSFKTNSKKAPANSKAKINLIRYELLHEHVSKRMKELDAGNHNGGEKAGWRYTVADAEAITTLKTATSVYNLMHSQKTKYPESLIENPEFDAALRIVSAKRTAMLKAAKTTSVPKIPAHIADKLAKGTKATLSAAEAAELFKILEAIEKAK